MLGTCEDVIADWYRNPFGTGNPGRCTLELYDGALDTPAFASAKTKVRLALEVADRSVCFRDLYDLMNWEPECPEAQSVYLENGYYRVTAYTSLPLSGIVCDCQVIWVYFERWPERPLLVWSGVPDLAPG